MAAWVFVFVLALLLVVSLLLLRRATARLFEFDEIFRIIVDPMDEYAAVLRRLASAEGLLHDHPEVVAFHRANMKMLLSIESAVASVKLALPPTPKDEPKGLAPEAE